MMMTLDIEAAPDFAGEAKFRRANSLHLLARGVEKWQ